MTSFASPSGRAAIRQLAAFATVAFCGYFSLGTSCDSIIETIETRVALHYDAGDGTAFLKVRASGERVTIVVDSGLTVPLRLPDTAAAPGVALGSAGSAGASSTPLEGGESALPAGPSDPQGACTVSGLENRCEVEVPFSEGPFEATFRVIRSDTSVEQEVTAVVSVAGEGDCDGGPANISVRAEQVEVP